MPIEIVGHFVRVNKNGEEMSPKWMKKRFYCNSSVNTRGSASSSSIQLLAGPNKLVDRQRDIFTGSSWQHFSLDIIKHSLISNTGNWLVYSGWIAICQSAVPGQVTEFLCCRKWGTCLLISLRHDNLIFRRQEFFFLGTTVVARYQEGANSLHVKDVAKALQCLVHSLS